MNLYDIAKCFDARQFQETENDMWDAGMKAERFEVKYWNEYTSWDV